MSHERGSGPAKKDGAPKGPISSFSGRHTTDTNAPSISRQLQRRRDAARRIPPIGPCSCIRDPESERHRCGGEISYVMVKAGLAAIAHLDHLGTPGLLDTDTCRALYRTGHRDLAMQVHRRSSGQAA